MHARRRPLAMFGLVAALVLAALALLPDPTQVAVAETVGTETTQPASAGVWYCPTTDAADVESRIEQAAPPGGGRPALFEAMPFGGDVRESDEGLGTGELFPGAGASLVPQDSSRATEVRWNDSPMVVSRLVEHGGDSPGPVIGPCAPSVATSWFVAGVTTAAGATADLHVGNPFSTEAAVTVDFLTPAGIEEPLAVANVPVPAGGTTVIDLAEVMPQREDLGVRVRARSGRVAVEGVQASVPTISGVKGRSWVGATERAATTWYLPWVATAGDGTAGFGAEEPATPDEPTEASTDPEEIDVVVEGEADPRSWIWVSNPAEEVAELNLSLLTPGGRVAPEVAAPLQVGPGAILRLDLEPYLVGREGDVGAQVVSTNDVPVVVGGAAVVATGGGTDRTGLAILSGQRSADTNWTLSGTSTGDRKQLLTLANPTDEPAQFSVSVWTGVTNVRPADLQELQVGPGATMTVDLGELELPQASFTAFVGVTEGQVTASLRSATPDGPLGLSVVPGVPSRIWVSSGIVTVVNRADGMVNRYGTGLGLEAVEPAPTPTPEPADRPSPGVGASDGATGDPGATSPGPTAPTPTTTASPTAPTTTASPTAPSSGSPPAPSPSSSPAG